MSTHIPSSRYASLKEKQKNEKVLLNVYGFDGHEYNMPDSYLSKAYRRTVIEKTIHKVFYDGSINNTYDFIKFFKQKHIELTFVDYGKEEAGFFWLSPFVGRSSFITYCLYKNHLQESLLISRACITDIFSRKDSDGRYKIDTLVSLTPANNKLALRFLKKIGMEISGTIPDLVYDDKTHKNIDGILTHLSRSPSKKKNSFPFWDWQAR